MFVRSEAQDHVTDEYGGRFRRLYPWEGVASPPWGGAIMTIAPGDSSTPHNHDEEETFIFLSGEGVMSVDDETRRVGKGDVVYLPRFSRHLVKNVSPDKPLEVLCVWWGAPRTASQL
jgi:oxalate decarboxylase/phosphoglucose isomerase-like protein (cupin superfamily)